MSALQKTLLTPEQYLEIEREAEFKSEYFSGEMFAMAGAPGRHCTIVDNLVRRIGNQFDGRPCRTFSSDMRVNIPLTKAYTYPDVIAVCGEPVFADEGEDILVNPMLIIEVLSPSTRRFDRGEKFAHYQRLESLRDYVLISQEEMHIEHFARQPDGSWPSSPSEANGPDAVVDIPIVGCYLLLSEVYERINFSVKETTPDTANGMLRVI